MKKIKLDEIKEKGTYIVESNTRLNSKNTIPTRKSEFDSNFEFEYSQLITVLKIELPYYVIKGRHGKEFVRLTGEYRFFEPSEDFTKILNHNCQCDY